MWCSPVNDDNNISSRAKAATDINWRYLGDAIPAFLTIAIMPFTYSIAYGLIAGIMSYITINTIIWLLELASGGRLKVADKEHKDFWTYKIEGGLLPPWLIRVCKGKKDFWRPYDDVEHNEAPTGTHIDGRDAPTGEEKSGQTPDVDEFGRERTSSSEKVKT